MSKLMYQIRFEGDSRYELILYRTRQEALEVARNVGERYRIRAIRVKDRSLVSIV